jgi:hypothetical protein
MKEEMVELRKKWDRLKGMSHLEENLLLERADIESAILEMSSKLNKLRVSGVEKGSEEYKEYSKHEKEYYNLKERLIEVDHRIDELEDDLEESRDKVRDRLVAAIVGGDSKKSTWYDDHVRTTTALDSEKKLLLAQEEIFREVKLELDEAIAGWKAANRRGLLTKMFGQSPSVLIGGHIEKGGKRAKSGLMVIDKLLVGHEEVREGTKDLFSRIVGECERYWNYKTVGKVMVPLVEELKEYEGKLKAVLSQVEGRISELEEELDEWIERN